MTTTLANGTIAQIFGPVVDVRFDPGQLPAIYNALTVTDAAKGIEEACKRAPKL